VIAWKKEGTIQGFSIPWEKIVVQAISQLPERSVYFMIDGKWSSSNSNSQESNGTNGLSTDEGNIDEEDDDQERIDDDDDSEGSAEFIDLDNGEDDQEITEFWVIIYLTIYLIRCLI
jgi:hypothetical protein